MITAHTVLVFEQSASVQSVGDGAVILLVDSGQIFTGNETADLILRSVDGQQCIGDIAAVVCDEFDVTFEVATRDVIEITKSLIDEGVLRVAEQKP